TGGPRLRDHLAVEIDVVVVDFLRQTAGDICRAALLPCRRCGTQVEQVRGRTSEVHLLPVDGHVFEQAMRVPFREFGIAEIWNLLAYFFLHLTGGEAEIQAHALHSLALELERTLRLRRQTRLLQRRI